MIGNAPLEPSEERRDLIDSADVVIRCNSLALDRPARRPASARGPPSSSPPGRRGRRRGSSPTTATVRTSWSTSSTSRSRSRPGWPASWPADLGAWPLPNRALGLPLKYLLRPSDAGHGLAPTTGTQSAYLAYRLFPDADIVLTGYSFLDDSGSTELGLPPRGRATARRCTRRTSWTARVRTSGAWSTVERSGTWHDTRSRRRAPAPAPPPAERPPGTTCWSSGSRSWSPPRRSRPRSSPASRSGSAGPRSGSRTSS